MSQEGFSKSLEDGLEIQLEVFCDTHFWFYGQINILKRLKKLEISDFTIPLLELLMEVNDYTEKNDAQELCLLCRNLVSKVKLWKDNFTKLMISLDSLLAEVHKKFKLIIKKCLMSNSTLDIFTFFSFPPLLLKSSRPHGTALTTPVKT